MWKYLVALAVAMVLAVSGGIGFVHSRDDGSPVTAPASAREVPLGAQQNLAGVIDALQVRLQELPEDAESWAALGLSYVEQARVDGNPQYYPKAQGAIERSLSVQPTDNADGLAARAALESARHHFAAALHSARQSLRINPRDRTALAIRVDALAELGRYTDELKALRLADNRQPGIPVVARYSYAYELRGHLDKALHLLLRSAKSGSRADQAYLLTLAADLQRRTGHPDAAMRSLHLALRSTPGYVPALASRARLAVAQGNLHIAVHRWRDVAARLPLPEYLTELGELYLDLGHRAQAARQFAVVGTTVRLFDAAGVDTDLEAALFDADHGVEHRALVNARDEWQRRHSVLVADSLAWALHMNGHDRAALRMSDKATHLGTRDARMWMHRGQIEAALGLDAAARRDLRLGLSLDPGVSPWQADRAREVLRQVVGR
jgi:tetratricopeptide (TPR) repeat protein